MKNIITLSTFLLLFICTFTVNSFNVNSLSSEDLIPSCEEICLMVVDSFENEYGCLDAEDASELDQVLYDHYCR